jgi:hypothetical protein
MTNSGRNILDRLPAVEYDPSFRGFYSLGKPMLKFEGSHLRLEYEGNDLITTGAFYLEVLGVQIPDFEVCEV